MNELLEQHFEGKIAQKAIIVRGEKVLLLRDPREQEVVWELPGGRINIDEDPKEALKRELLEELGVLCEIGEVVHVEQFFQKSDRKNAFLIVYIGALVDGDVAFQVDSREVCDVGWFSKDEVASLNLFPEYEHALEVYFKD